MSTVQPVCRDDEIRRADLLDAPPGSVDLNGIDFVEIDPADHRIIKVFFLKDLPADAYELPLDPAAIAVRGGTRVVGITVVAATRETARRLRVDVDKPGDFSAYVLELPAHPGLDDELRRITFSFMASCPADVDCGSELSCPPRPLPEAPLLDYQAKDYASFRRMLLDLLPQLNPDFVERNPSDLGIALVELLAYEGDHLSYFQDAVANEAFLETARRRISVRRHARLIDYRMHDGRNAWTAIHVVVGEGGPGTLASGTPVLTRIAAPLAHTTGPPGAILPLSSITVEALEADPALAATTVFETTHDQDRLASENNEIAIHTWGGEECCLAPGTIEAYLYSVAPGSDVAGRPNLAAGDLLLLEEARGPATGAAADADHAHRQLVRLEEAEETTDQLYGETLSGGATQVRSPADPELPLLRVRWRREDALAFPLCLSARLADGKIVRNVSVARGNIVLVDHGFTIEEPLAPPPEAAASRVALTRGPLTIECRPDDVVYDGSSGRLRTDRFQLDCDVHRAQPAVALLADTPASLGPQLWTPVPDLLDSTPFAEEFVAEVDDEGVGRLRFGDGEFGRIPEEVSELRAVYRIGNGRAGNVGAEALAHLALDGPAPWVVSVRNPLPARGGVDPETIEQVRQLAPEAFRAATFRAVTEADWAAAARTLPEVAGAVATFRWTGSWFTVFVGLDPRDPADLVTEAEGLIRLSPAFARRVRAFLTRYRLAGYDIEVRPPRFVPLQLELDVCAAAGHFRSDVAAAVADALSARVLRDGSRGFFHPDNFTFGQPVYLSRIYAAVERVEGVDSAAVRVFRRYARPDAGELASGVLTVGPWEIAQLENDPNFAERGALHVTALGGKA